MTRGRLTAQIQNDQLDLFRLQNQLSTGFRLFLPSDDASSAQRAMVLQRTLERKEQSVTNLQGARASLVTTESSLNGLNATLNELKSQALGVVDSIASESERRSVIDSINGALFELTRVGNATFASNYLLGGAERSTQAYTQTETYVEYLGDEGSPQTFIDIGQLFDQGLSGSEVLGGVASAVRGSNDLNVQLTPETKLSQLNAGVGAANSGSIEIVHVPSSASDPTTSSAIDLSNATTINDVARLIEAGAPEGSGVVVSIEADSLRIDAADGTITVGEVGDGSVARQLGILSVGGPSATIDGADLNPTLRGTTPLDDLVGAKARGRVVPPGDNNDLQITAKVNGADLNGLSVVFQGGASLGAESAAYDSGTNTLTVTIADGETTAARVADVINADASLPLAAEVDYRDQTSPDTRGSGAISVPAVPGTDLAVGVQGGVDGQLDLSSGLLLTNGDETFEIDTSGATTVEGLLGILNDDQYGLLASVNQAGDGIDVRTRRSGADFTIAENGGTTATQLGIRTYTASSLLADFNRGVGVLVEGENPTDTLIQNQFQITVSDLGVETAYDIDPTGLTTVQDLIDRINGPTAEGGAGGAVIASLATTGNGITLTRADAIDPPAAATGTALLAGDTLNFTADEQGNAGNNAFSVFITDSGGTGGLTSNLVGDTITVDLGGSTTETTATIAASISGVLPDHTVTVTPAGASAAAVTSPPVVFPVSFPAVVFGGRDADEFRVSGAYAQRLGFVPPGEESITSTGDALTSTDRNPLEVDSVFTTLIRMREALEAGDREAFEREVERIDDDIDRVSFARAEVGVRLQNLDAVSNRLADEEVTLREALSQEIDADLIEVISEFTAKQAALQASLQTSGALLNLSILDFI